MNVKIFEIHTKEAQVQHEWQNQTQCIQVCIQEGFPQKFHTEWIFMVIDRLNTNPSIYHIKDDDGNFIEGTFYEKKLVKVTEE